MKKILYLLLFCISSALSIHQAQAQGATTPETSLFKVEDNAVIWQKVYDINVTPKEYLTFIKLKACLEDIDTLQNTIIGKLRKFKLNLNGFSFADTPIYMKSTVTLGDVRIEIKEQKYRVTVYNIKVMSETTSGLFKAGDLRNLEEYYFKSGGKGKEPRPNFIKFNEPIYTKNFDSFFEYKKASSDF